MMISYALEVSIDHNWSFFDYLPWAYNVLRTCSLQSKELLNPGT